MCICGFSSALRIRKRRGGGHNCDALQCWKPDLRLQGCGTATDPLHCLMRNVRDRDPSEQRASPPACRCRTPRCKAQHLLLPPPGTNDAIQVGSTCFGSQGRRLITCRQLIAFCRLRPRHTTRERKIPPIGTRSSTEMGPLQAQVTPSPTEWAFMGHIGGTSRQQPPLQHLRLTA